MVLLGNSHLEFSIHPNSGFRALGDVRSMLEINSEKQRLILVGRNDSFVDAYVQDHNPIERGRVLQTPHINR